MSLIKEALFDFISSCDRNIEQLYFGINQAVNYFKLANICDYMRVSTSGFTYGVLGGIRGYTAYTNLRRFLTAYTHLSDHK